MSSRMLLVVLGMALTSWLGCATTRGGLPAPAAETVPAKAAAVAEATDAELELAAAGVGSTGKPNDSIWPTSGVSLDPLAVRFCAAIHALPQQRRDACCVTPAAPDAGPASTTAAVGNLAGECARTLSVAVADGAVRLGVAALAACELASERELAGCDWVRPLPPAIPDACAELVEGTRAAGESCRSGLECGAGFTCLGASRTSLGTCFESGAAGMPCSTADDILVSYTRQRSADTSNRPCRGTCREGRCVDPVVPGGNCSSSAQCGVGALCVERRCVTAAPPPAGEACLAGTCAAGAVCIAGRCQSPAPTGAPCSSPFECRGSCLKPPGSTTGVCGPGCAAPGLGG